MHKRITKAVIPAAGMGTRFLPATIAQPKEMLPIVDKPVIQFVVEEAVESGIKDILIITGRSKRAIEDHFDPSSELEDILIKKKKDELVKTLDYISNLANIHFVRQRRQRGIADAVYQAKTFVGDDPFAVLLGDTIIYSEGRVNNLAKMIEIFRQRGKNIVALEHTPPELVSRYGIAGGKMISERLMEVSELVEKPEADKAPSDLAIATRYIFTPAIFEMIERTKPGVGGEMQITDSMKFLAKAGEMLGYIIDGRRYDIGNKVDFVKTNIDFALRRPDTKAEIAEYIKEISKELK